MNTRGQPRRKPSREETLPKYDHAGRPPQPLGLHVVGSRGKCRRQLIGEVSVEIDGFGLGLLAR